MTKCKCIYHVYAYPENRSLTHIHTNSSGRGGQLAHTFLIWGVKLLLELLSQQPSLYRSVCPFFLSHSLFLAFIPSQLPAFPLAHFYPSVFVCIASSILPSPISFSLTNLALFPWQPLVLPRSQCIPQVCAHGQCHSHALCPAPKRQPSHVAIHMACVTRMRSGPHPS